jgi:tRNA 2-thiouridine synthesizing protein E
MSSLMVNDVEVALTADGRLKNLEDWSEGVARALAAQDGLALTDEHWDVIRLMREYYRQFNIPPIKKLLKKTLRKQLGESCATDRHLNKLFPVGVLVQGTRIAGLPIPHLDAEVEDGLSEVMSGSEGVREDVAIAEQLTPFKFEGQTYHLRRNGNLVEHHAWNERMAVFLADRENISLTDDHWSVINFLRKFYFDYGITPMVRLLINHMRDAVGESISDSEYLYRLFPGGPSRQGSRIAGLPEPQGCIDE